MIFLPLSISLLQGLPHVYTGMLDDIPQVSEALLSFYLSSFFIFFFCFSDLLMTIYLIFKFTDSLMCHLNLILSLSTEVFISVIAVFSSRNFPFGSYFIIFLFVLRFSSCWCIVILLSFNSLNIVSFNPLNILTYLLWSLCLLNPTSGPLREFLLTAFSPEYRSHLSVSLHVSWFFFQTWTFLIIYYNSSGIQLHPLQLLAWLLLFV